LTQPSFINKRKKPVLLIIVGLLLISILLLIGLKVINKPKESSLSLNESEESVLVATPDNIDADVNIKDPSNVKTYLNQINGITFEFDPSLLMYWEDENMVKLKLTYNDDRSSFFFIEFLEGKCDINNNTNEYKEIKIDSQKAYYYEFAGAYDHFYVTACLQKNDNRFVFSYSFPKDISKEERTKHAQLFNQIISSFKTLPPDNKLITTKKYVSESLGIEFTFYDKTTTGDIVTVKEDGNIIYPHLVSEEITDINQVDYVEVVFIEDGVEVFEAMKKYILDNYSVDNCVNVYNIQGEYPENQSWEVICPNESENGYTGGIDGYFLYDKDVSDKFVIVDNQSEGKNTNIKGENFLPWYYVSFLK